MVIVVLYVQEVFVHFIYIVTYYIKWVKTWTYSNMGGYECYPRFRQDHLCYSRKFKRRPLSDGTLWIHSGSRRRPMGPKTLKGGPNRHIEDSKGNNIYTPCQKDVSSASSNKSRQGDNHQDNENNEIIHGSYIRR